ncbi:MAG TPA: aminomethyl-transferring glycine dehydrogenase subunit GcvPA [Polyangiaceae bacterium LLY-WYZ-14_1]|nr:aminomethyl-transferring glycine dehydrogenase subunit GcvPA [Polyangiaceae bacterium LLY-WYZ-14_1]
MRYLPHTSQEVEAMLRRIGVDHVDRLFDSVPEAYRRERPLDLEPALSEPELMRHLNELADRNPAATQLSFLGGGMYDHHLPPAVDQLILRSEFYTAYTPYQAEVSQGTLQAIFEFQTLCCELFGMEVANASMYDAASGAAEAALMARRVTRKTTILVSAGLHPDHRRAVETYLRWVDTKDGDDPGGPRIETVPLQDDGRTDVAALTKRLQDGDVAGLLVGYPNFFGVVEDLGALRAAIADHPALLATVTTEPYALAVLEPPGRAGVDIAVGEGQGLAVPPQYGGPGVGLFACRGKYMRQIPGRLVGETVDAHGERGFVLTLSTREQHIRRERATSNICTNHGLIALAMTIRTALLGREGFVQTGRMCLSKAEYLKARLDGLPGIDLPFAGPTFNEFAVRRTDGGTAAELVGALSRSQGILAGVDLGRFDPNRADTLLVAVTEKHRREDLDRLVDAVASATS